MSEKTGSLVNLVAWLSVCLLAAAWGPTLGAPWRMLWTIMGSFGLTAALGLQGVERVRRRREQRLLQKEADHRYEHRMAKLEAKRQANNVVAEAVQRIIEDAEQTGSACWDTESPYSGRRAEPRILCRIPVEVSRLSDLEETLQRDDGDCVTGYIQDISPSGVGLLHRQPLDAHRVALRVELSDGTQIALVAALIWREPEKDGWYSSGGKLVQVLKLGRSRRTEPCTLSG